MIKKTVAAGIAALAIAGVLGGAALTSTAGADTPRTPTAAGDVTAQFSKGFNVFNTIGTIDLKLVGLEGFHEGAPPIGSILSYGQFQRFEVAHANKVLATYQLGSGANFSIEMTYGFFGDVSARVVYNYTGMRLAIDHPGDETWGIQFNI